VELMVLEGPWMLLMERMGLGAWPASGHGAGHQCHRR
jgi:hypothetical protein